MIRYHPIESGVPWGDADEADLREFNWQERTAEFMIFGDPRVLKVSFSAPVIVRMLDELPLCTESTAGLREGQSSHCFAYRVEGDPFFDAQSETWREIYGPATHYRFLTGAGCLDVISTSFPSFQIANA